MNGAQRYLNFDVRIREVPENPLIANVIRPDHMFKVHHSTTRLDLVCLHFLPGHVPFELPVSPDRSIFSPVPVITCGVQFRATTVVDPPSLSKSNAGSFTLKHG